MFNKIGPMIVPQLVEFVEAETKISGVKAEYYISGDGVKFHFFGDPTLPENLGDIIDKALSGYPKDCVFKEYVPEVDSWYAHIKGTPIGLSPALVEGIISKIAITAEALNE